MTSTIGKKIKELRKELKMTQSELAEPEMKKSMLSHIENGYANPSMKNLEHIAKKLNKPLSYFFKDDTVYEEQFEQENNSSLEIIIGELKTIDHLIKRKKYELAKEEIIKCVAIYIIHKTSKLYADILYRLASCELMLGEFDKGEKDINICFNIYMKNMLYVDAARAYMKLIKVYIHNYEYNQVIQMLERTNEIYDKSSSKDVFLEIEMLVIQPAIYFAKGDFQKAIQVCEEAISLSNENKIYYLLDDAYRMRAITYLLHNNFDQFLINMDKARKYVEFTDNKLNLIKIIHSYAKYENMINNPSDALKYLKAYDDNNEKKTFYYYLEHGKAEYLLGNYEKALDDLEQIAYEDKINYMMDCIYILTSKIYKGLIYSKLNDFDKAVKEIEDAIKEIQSYTKSEYAGFVTYANKELSYAYECLSEVYYEKGKFSEAYTLLKKSNELKILLKNI